MMSRQSLQAALRDYVYALRHLQSDVRLYLSTAMLIGFATSGIFSVLLNIYLLRLGYEAGFIGVVNAAGQAAFIILSFVVGAISNRYGARRLILVGIAAYFLGYFLLSLAELVPSPFQPAWLVGANLIASFGGPLYWVNGNLFLMDKTGAVERNHAFSLRSAFFPLSGFLGSLVGGFLPGRFAAFLGVTLDDPAPYRYSLLLAALLVLPALVAMVRAGDTKRVKQSTRVAWRVAPLHLFVPLSLVMFVRATGEFAGRNFFNVYMDSGLGVPTAQIGTVAAIGLFMSVPAALLTPTLASRWGNDRVYLVGMVGMSLSFLPLALLPTPTMATVGYVMLLTFASATKPTLYVYRLEILAATWWAAMSGTGGTMHGLGQAVASLGGGYVIELLGFRTFYLVAAGLTLMGAIYFAFFSRIPRREAAGPQTSPAD